MDSATLGDDERRAVRISDGELIRRAEQLRHRLVAAIAARGDLRDAALRDAFERVPRHEFVPLFYDHDLTPVSRHQPEQAETWLAQVYADQALATQLEDGRVVSSSSQPSLMAVMLEALDLDGDERILEVGTGSGYNAALLCQRLGEYRVITVDVDPEITSLARSRLLDVGFQPLVVTGDGLLGYPARAPYERVIVTVGVDHLPPAWIDQLTDDGLLVAPLGAGVVKLRKTGPREAQGRFLPTPAYFMPIRGSDTPETLRRPGRPLGRRRLSVVPERVLDELDFRFLVSLTMPRLQEEQHGGTTWLWTSDGSIAELTPEGVTEAGPRRLWSEIEELYRVFAAHKRPERERFAVTVSRETQLLWLDPPDGPRWHLPRSAP